MADTVAGWPINVGLMGVYRLVPAARAASGGLHVGRAARRSPRSTRSSWRSKSRRRRRCERAQPSSASSSSTPDDAALLDRLAAVGHGSASFRRRVATVSCSATASSIRRSRALTRAQDGLSASDDRRAVAGDVDAQGRRHARPRASRRGPRSSCSWIQTWPPALALRRSARRRGSAAPRSLAEELADALADGGLPLAEPFLETETDRTHPRPRGCRTRLGGRASPRPRPPARPRLRRARDRSRAQVRRRGRASNQSARLSKRSATCASPKARSSAAPWPTWDCTCRSSHRHGDTTRRTSC